MKKADFDLAKAEERAREELQAAQAERRALVTELAEGADVTDRIESIEEEIVQLSKQLARFADAKAVVVQAASDEGKREQHEATLASLASARDRTQSLAEQAKDVLLTIATLQAQLAGIQDTRDAIGALLHGAALDVRHGAPSERVLGDTREQLNMALHDITLPVSLAQAVWDSGLSRVGVFVPDEWIHVRPLMDAPPEVEATSTRALAKVGQLIERIESWSTKLNVPSKEAA